MSHLAIERLAELAGGEPRPDEQAHLDECVMCASELVAYRRLVQAAADERRRIAPPLTNWGALSQRMRQEGLITTPLSAAERQSRRGVVWLWRTAASLVLVASGTVLGRLSAGLPMQEALALGSVGNVEQAGGLTPQEFASTAEAMQVLQQAQREYERAAVYLATHDTSTTEASRELYRTRLAALDAMAEASLRVLEQAPADPIMNQVYLTTLGAREMTLSRLGTALSGNSRLTRF